MSNEKINHLEKAKYLLALGEYGEDSRRLAPAALAHAVIALVERIDALTDTGDVQEYPPAIRIVGNIDADVEL